jgi:hypothetical protein
MTRRTLWLAVFLPTTLAAVGEELWAALDHDPDTVPWTELLTDLPPWLTLPAAVLLSVWLTPHLIHWYRLRRATESPEVTVITSPVPPTQVRHPWRATARTVFAGLVGLATLLPEIATAAHMNTVPAVGQVLAVSAVITRIMAVPGVNRWLGRILPWLAASPSQP